jgi:ketosteroid isomerase-like protein
VETFYELAAKFEDTMMCTVREVGKVKRALSEQARVFSAMGVMVFIIASASFAFSQTQAGGEIQEITDLEHQRASAVVHRDTDFLDKITASDSIRITPTGALETKAQLLSQLTSGSVTYSAIDVDQLSVNVYGATAVVTGRSAVRGQRDGKPFQGTWRFSRVWIRKEGRWQEVLFQLTQIREP